MPSKSLSVVQRLFLGALLASASMYTHSHVDHFGGVRGVVNEADVVLGKVPMADLMKRGAVKLEGDPKALGAVFANLETPNPGFNIVSPE